MIVISEKNKEQIKALLPYFSEIETTLCEADAEDIINDLLTTIEELQERYDELANNNF